MGTKKKNDNKTDEEAVVIPLDLEEEIEEPEQAAEQPAGEAVGGRLDLNQLKEMSINQLSSAAKGLGVESPAGMRRQDLIFSILQHQTEAGRRSGVSTSTRATPYRGRSDRPRKGSATSL